MPVSTVVILRTIVLTAHTIMNNSQKLNNNFLDNHGVNLSYDGRQQGEKSGSSSLAIALAQYGGDVFGHVYEHARIVLIYDAIFLDPTSNMPSIAAAQPPTTLATT